VKLPLKGCHGVGLGSTKGASRSLVLVERASVWLTLALLQLQGQIVRLVLKEDGTATRASLPIVLLHEGVQSKVNIFDSPLQELLIVVCLIKLGHLSIHGREPIERLAHGSAHFLIHLMILPE